MIDKQLYNEYQEVRFLIILKELCIKDKKF